MLSGRTFLITGATGRLGRDLTARLEDLGAEVLPLVLEGYPPVPKNVDWIARTQPILVNSLRDLEDLPFPDHVIHLHWQVDRTRTFAEQVVNELEWNVGRPVFLWDWLKTSGCLKTFVNCSSIRVYSHQNQNPVSAKTIPRPVTPYGVAKLAGETFFTAYFESGVPVTHLRLSSVCSHGEHPTHLISRLVSGSFDGKRIQVNAGHSVNLLHIDEVVDVMIQAAVLGRPGPFLAVAPEQPITEVAKVFEAVSGRTLNAEYVDLSPGMSDTQFQSDLKTFHADWVRQTSIEEGIARILSQRGGSNP